MSSACGSALTPISRTVRPLTDTRPSSISRSAARREATPACERIFCRRMAEGPLFTLPCSHFPVRVHVRFCVRCSTCPVRATRSIEHDPGTRNSELRTPNRTENTNREPSTRKSELLLDYRCPEADELPRVHRRGVGIHAGVRDQTAQQDLGPHALRSQMLRQEDALGRRDDVVL